MHVISFGSDSISSFSTLSLHDDPAPPALTKDGLRSSALFCGEPAWDPDLYRTDLFMLLPLAWLEGCCAEPYVGETETV